MFFFAQNRNRIEWNRKLVFELFIAKFDCEYLKLIFRMTRTKRQKKISKSRGNTSGRSLCLKNRWFYQWIDFKLFCFLFSTDFGIRIIPSSGWSALFMGTWKGNYPSMDGIFAVHLYNGGVKGRDHYEQSEIYRQKFRLWLSSSLAGNWITY